MRFLTNPIFGLLANLLCGVTFLIYSSYSIGTIEEFSLLIIGPGLRFSNPSQTRKHIRAFVEKILLLVVFSAFIVLVIYDEIPFVILLSPIVRLIFDNVTRQFLLIQYELYYKNKLVDLINLNILTSLKFLFLVKKS